jgi:hypothetical protein
MVLIMTARMGGAAPGQFLTHAGQVARLRQTADARLFDLAFTMVPNRRVQLLMAEEAAPAMLSELVCQNFGDMRFALASCGNHRLLEDVRRSMAEREC